MCERELMYRCQLSLINLQFSWVEILYSNCRTSLFLNIELSPGGEPSYTHTSKYIYTFFYPAKEAGKVFIKSFIQKSIAQCIKYNWSLILLELIIQLIAFQDFFSKTKAQIYNIGLKKVLTDFVLIYFCLLFVINYGFFFLPLWLFSRNWALSLPGLCLSLI